MKNNTYKTFDRPNDLLSYRMQTKLGFRFHFFYFRQDSKSRLFIEGIFLDVSDIREAEKPFFKRRGVKKTQDQRQKLINGRHKQRSGQHTLAPPKIYKKIIRQATWHDCLSNLQGGGDV
jgi:hypothetical protein